MPLRREICQKATLSSRQIASNGVWITNDVLCDAFNSFLRHSRGAKRFGSHVPGPLEAQRRLAKRRMMALAGAGVAPGPDPIALFGSSGPRMENMVWQAPNKQAQAGRETQELVASNPWWFEGVLGLTPPVGKEEVSNAETPIETQTLGTKTAIAYPGDADPLIELRKEFENATISQMASLADRAADMGIEHVDFCKAAFAYLMWYQQRSFEQIMDFMLNPRLNVPEARHLTLMISELHERLPISGFGLVKRVVEACFKLGLVADEEIPGLVDTAFRKISSLRPILKGKGIASRRHPKSLIDAIWRGVCGNRVANASAATAMLILEQLPRDRSMCSFRFELLRHAFPAPHLTPSEERIEEWIAAWTIQACGPRCGTKMNMSVLTDILEDLYPSFLSAKSLVEVTKLLPRASKYLGWYVVTTGNQISLMRNWLSCLQKAITYPVWEPVLAEIAAAGLSPIDITECLSQIAPKQFVGEALLLRWLPRLQAHGLYDVPLKEQSLQYVEDEAMSRAQQNAKTVSMELVLADFRALHRQIKSPHDYDVFACLLIALHRHCQLTILNQSLLLSTCERLHGPYAVADVCTHVRSAGVYIYTHVMGDLIARQVQAHPHAALALYKARPVYIHRMPRFLPLLIESGVHRDEILKILSDEDPAAQVPIEQRCNPRSSLTFDWIELVHKCADAFSRQQVDETARYQFRSVYLCYKFLISRGAPLSPIMSRAFVRAGITNYLQADIAVGQEQVKWILGLVERVEGQDVADELDPLLHAWISRVYKSWNKRDMPRRRTFAPLPKGKQRRGANGLYKMNFNFDWQRDQYKIPARIRRYLEDGTVKYRDIHKIPGVTPKFPSRTLSTAGEEGH